MALQLVVPHLPRAAAGHKRRDLVGIDMVPAIKLPKPPVDNPTSW
jgi:hypothetical protein